MRALGPGIAMASGSLASGRQIGCHGRVHEDFVGGGHESGKLRPSLLSFRGVGVSADCRFDALVGGLVVVFPDRDDPAVLSFPSADQAGAVTELDWQEVAPKEIMKHRQVLPDGLIDTHPVDHHLVTTAPSPTVGRHVVRHPRQMRAFRAPGRLCPPGR